MLLRRSKEAADQDRKERGIEFDDYLEAVDHDVYKHVFGTANDEFFCSFLDDITFNRSLSPLPPIPASLQERDTRSCRLRHCQANTGMLGLWRSYMEGGRKHRQHRKLSELWEE